MAGMEMSEQPEYKQGFELEKIEWAPQEIVPGIDLSDRLAVLRVEGVDAEAFLQGQLTQDMAKVARGESLRAAHCTPKGRMTAIFDVAYHEGAFILLLPKSRAQAALDRLKKYVLRSRVVFTLDTETCLMKAWGAANDAPPLNSLHALFTGIHHRVYVVDQARLEGLHARTDRLSESQARLNEFRAQWAYLGSATEEVFIPQMLNLDETGGISFKKGCYTGQEIVARTHYLGRVKRRMALFQFRAECPEVGTKIETSAWGGLTVVDAIRGEGPWGYLLAVLAGSDEQ